MKIEKKSSPMPSWLDKLADVMQVKRTAAVNVESLPTVSWKEETYYVNFTDDGNAVLYNRFGNKVTTVNSAKTMDDVEIFLDQDSIVAQSEKPAVTADNDAQTDGQSAPSTDSCAPAPAPAQPQTGEQPAVSEPLPGTTTAEVDNEFDAAVVKCVNVVWCFL